MVIYDSTVEKVRKGATFKVILESRALVVNGKKVIDNGKYEGELGIPQLPLEKMLEQIEYLYDQYKHSVPSERSERKRKRYFKALNEEELDDDDMRYGFFRDEAQVCLELAVLCFILNGSFVWDEEKMGKWFWQSGKDKDLVILRQWVENNNTNI